MQPKPIRDRYAYTPRAKRPFAFYYKPTHAELRAQYEPIITRGPFSLIWVNPNEPVVREDDFYDDGEIVED